MISRDPMHLDGAALDVVGVGDRHPVGQRLLGGWHGDPSRLAHYEGQLRLEAVWATVPCKAAAWLLK